MLLKATKEKQEQRIKICEECPHSKKSKITGLTCGDFMQPTYDENGNVFTCGCNLKAKVVFFSQQCPQKKW